MDWGLHDSLAVFKPYGFANEKPRFATNDLLVTSVRAVGNQGKHLKLELKSSQKDANVFPAIAFGFGDLVDRINFKDKVDVAYELEVNEWNGNRELQFHVLDIKKSN